jgi:hypothetical protein
MTAPVVTTGQTMQFILPDMCVLHVKALRELHVHRVSPETYWGTNDHALILFLILIPILFAILFFQVQNRGGRACANKPGRPPQGE